MLRAGIDRKYAFILLGASGILLALGITFRPGQAPGEEAPSEIEILRLQRLAEERRLRDLSSFLNDAASRAATGLVALLPARATGLLWGSPPGVLIARDVAAAGDLTAIAWDGTPHAVRRTGSDPNQPFELLTVAQTGGLVARPRSSNPPGPGEWILAVARGPSNEAVFAHGIYQGITAARCGDFLYQAMQTSIPLSAALTGGGVFTIDGQLLGFITRCRAEPIMIAAAAIEQSLRMPTPLETRIEQEYGLLLTKADPTESGRGHARRVTGVWIGSRAAQAGLRPGDELAPETDLQALVDHPDADHEVEVLRRDRSLTVRLEPSTKVLAATTLGVTLAEDEESGAVVVHAVAPEGAGWNAGLRPGDRVERVGNVVPRDAAAAAAAIERGRQNEVSVVVARDGKRLELLVAP